MVQEAYKSAALYAVGMDARMLGVSGHGFTQELVPYCNASRRRNRLSATEDLRADAERAAFQASLAPQ